MRRFLSGPGLVLCAALSAAPSIAAADKDYQVISHDGVWEVGTGKDDGGNAYCSLQDQSKDRKSGLILAIYPLGDDPSFEIHAFKDDWSIPANTEVPTSFNFSDGNNWDADGQAADDGSSVVDYDIDISDMQDFLADFGQSDRLDIVFSNGTEPDWKENLTGSAQASLDLLKCATKLLDQSGGAGSTQPFAPPDSPPDTTPPSASPPGVSPPDDSAPAAPGNGAISL